jgi:hypothetical protein
VPGAFGHRRVCRPATGCRCFDRSAQCGKPSQVPQRRQEPRQTSRSAAVDATAQTFMAWKGERCANRQTGPIAERSGSRTAAAGIARDGATVARRPTGWRYRSRRQGCGCGEMVVQMVAAGKTIDEILAEYPYLEAEDVKQALAYSAALAENECHLWLRPSA